MTIKPLIQDRISGVLILSAIISALIAANSPLADLYAAIHHAPIRVGLLPFQMREPLIVWINQGLMTIFFVLVGVEIKHELLEGHLSSLQRAAVPAIAAFGGMAVPALIYVALAAPDGEALRGWAIPMATDIVGSDVNTIVSNDAGINYKMSDNLSTRVSYRTDYNTDPVAGLKSTDNTLGVSLVLGF